MQFQLRPEYNEKQNLWEIELQGEIDIYNSPGVKDVLSNLIQEHPCDVVLNCEKLEYIDSTGLGALVAILKKVRLYDGNIHLKYLNPSILKVFKLTNLDKIFLIS